MNDLSDREYAALREAIATRGCVRPAFFVAGISSWTFALIGVLVWLPNPVAAAIPLVVLVCTFEAVRTLHTGVERIGRYLQVFFEETESNDGQRPLSPPAWERSAMLFGRSVPGASGHPLFLPLFILAAVVNLLAVVLPGPIPLELATMAVPHAAFVVWLVYCDRGMRQQRAAELARFREIKKGLAGKAHS